MRSKLRGRRPSPALIISCIALFAAMGGVAYAANTVRSGDIVNDAVTSADIKGGGGKTGDIKNRDVNALLAVAKGFATINAVPAAQTPTVLNFGGQQTATSPPGVSVQRIATGHYAVTFKANTGTGKFVNVNSVDDLATQVTARGFASAYIQTAGSSANANQVVLRVRVIKPNGGAFTDEDFSVQFYARTTN